MRLVHQRVAFRPSARNGISDCSVSGQREREKERGKQHKKEAATCEKDVIVRREKNEINVRL